MFTAPLDQDPVEILRLLRNLVAIGVVSEVDAESYSVRATVGDNETDWIRWGAARAGDDVDWWVPSVGEEVVLLSPGGDLERAVLLCALYSADVQPPSTDASQRVTTYAGGGRVVVDKSTNTATISGFDVINATASQKITATAPEISAVAETKITLDAPNVYCTGNLDVGKGFTAASAGGGETAVFKSPVDFQGSTVQHNGINIGGTHKHPGVETGDGETGGPQ
ncbi:phage baseplate assembly protein V [Salmonella enterica]|nr:phage baseplate assembly protein V [Salmonella enterica]EBI9231620.1 phage baseplate assembly protein V [Salmonella enterica]